MIKTILYFSQNLYNYIKKKVFKKTRYQFVILLIVSTIIPILSVQLINFHLTSKIILQKNAAILDDNLILSKTNANNVINNYQKLLYKIFTDEIFIKDFETFNKQEQYTFNNHFSICDKITNSITTHIRLYPEVRAIGIIGENNKTHMVIENRVKNQYIVDYFNNNLSEIFKDIESQSVASINLITKSVINDQEDDSVFYIKQRIINHENMKFLGGIVLFIDSKGLNDAINNKGSSIYKFSDKFIINEDNFIICSKGNASELDITKIPEYQDFDFSNNNIHIEYEKQNNFVSVVNLSNYNLRLINIVNNKTLLNDISNIWTYSIIIIIIIMIVAVILAILSSNNVIKSIERMSNIMNMLNKDNLNIYIETKSNNEIRTIENSFNYMIKRVQDLLQKNKEQYKYIIEITKKAHLAELHSLELQINPHFLFNTIDAINWMAIQKGYFDINIQLSNLAQILRHTIYHMNLKVPIGKEIEIIKCYLNLQQNRFRKFKYDVFINTQTDNLFIYKLIIQPFIENSILHGFENISYTGHIILRIFMLQNKYLVIKIIDNGVGMTFEKVNQANKLFRTGENENFGIGLKNVTYRVASYYQNKAKIYVRSDSNETCFTIYIPKDMLGA